MPFIRYTWFSGRRSSRASPASRNSRLRATWWLMAAGLALPAPAAEPLTFSRQEPGIRGSASLKNLVAEALQNNPEVRAAQREKEAAEQRIAPAAALDDPMLEAGVLNLPASSLRFDREDMTMKMIGLSQRLPYPGKRALRQDVASRDAESAGYGYQETVNRVARDVRIAWVDLGLVSQLTGIAEKNRAALEQLVRTSEGRYAVGQASQSDVLKAQTQLSRMRDDLLRLARERPAAEAELNRLLGRGFGAAAPVAELPQLRDEPPGLASLRESALARRPQLLALQSMVARNEKALDLARKDYYPDFDVRLSYGQRDNTPEGVRRADLVSLTVAINLPVWRDNKIAPRVAELHALRDRASDLYEAQRNETDARLRQQSVAAEQNLKSAHLYRTAILPQSRLAAESALAAYRVGRVDFPTLLDSQLAVYNVEAGLATAVANYNKAMAEIDLLAGRSPE